MPLTRRELLGTLGVTGVALGALPARLTLAADHGLLADRRLVLIILRGGLDGLSACPAWGDPAFERARAGIAVAPPGEADGALPLDGFFALHPALASLHGRWRAAELLVVHAHCTPYRERSHFDAQNVLETGATTPHALDGGWLNRALATLRRHSGDPQAGRPVALGTSVPLALRGEVETSSWAPSRLPSPREDLLARIETLYGDDETLAVAFSQARMTNALADASGMDGGGARANLPALARAAGRLLAAPDGPRVATLEAGGWDSHTAQERPLGGLHRAYRALDAALEDLRAHLGEAWRHTAVLVVTEFGRTVAMNGAGGTDHGTGSVAFLVGGAVRGGRVLADWPGLAPGDLHEGRDLRATTDTRALLKGVLAEHLDLPAQALAREVFPDSAGVKALGGLIRGGAA